MNSLRNQILQGPSDLVLQAYSGSANTWIAYWNSQSSQSIVNALGGATSIQHFYPNVARDIELLSIPNDPLFDDQWYLRNVGQLVSQPDNFNTYATWGEDIRAAEAWDTATGAGVVIAIVDDGFYYGHQDLGAYGTADYDPDKLNPAIGFDFTEEDLLPLPDTATDFHGTAVAGIAGATGNNGEGITGVAYDATLTGIRILGRLDLGEVHGQTDDSLGRALFLNPNEIDIYNNSWGAGGRQIVPMGPLETQATIDAALRGRLSEDGVNALGTILVFAAGNSGGEQSSANFKGETASVFTIPVGAVDHTGVATSYTETGANIWVVAPSGDGASGLTTTDLVGEVGYNATGLLNDNIGRDYLEDIDYTSRFNGTSAAAPVVSGVIALMLEAAANNGTELTLRDVQAILAKSARQNSVLDPGWQANAGTTWLNPVFGPGNGDEPDPAIPEDTSQTVTDGNIAPTPFPVTPPPDYDPTYLDPFIVGQGLQDAATLLNAAPPKFVNGAGYTVHNQSQAGSGGSPTYSYGHGVVDAEMAVYLAANWNQWDSMGTSVQQYALTTNTISFPGTSGDIPAAEEIVPNNWVPGSIGGESGFGEWLAEFYNQERVPFSEEDEPEYVSRGDYFSFPGPTDMLVEQVELTVNINVDPDEVEDLRIALMSPDGTISDFLNYTEGVGDLTPLVADENLTWTFSTGAFYGEKASKEFWDPTISPLLGTTVQKEWTLIIDNYSRSSTADLQSIEVNWYGKQVAEGRIKGFVGADIDGDGAVIYPDDTANFIPGQLDEVVGKTVVWLDIDGDGGRGANEPWQITGADGNYYFDVPVGTWQVGIELPDGYQIQTMPDPLDPMGPEIPVNPAYTIPALYPNNVVQTVEVGLDLDLAVPDDVQSAYFDLFGDTVTFSGTVYADVNEDGSPDGEPTLSGRTIYIDLDENGEFNDPNNPLEPFPDIITTQTGPDGTWSITASLTPGYYTIAIAPEDGFTPSNPAGGFYRIYVGPGDVITGLDFGAAPIQGDISGIVFYDELEPNNAPPNGIQDPGEGGVAGFELYIDLNGDGTRGLGEPLVSTDENGEFSFFGLQYSTYDIRVLGTPGWSITTANGGLESVEVVPGQVVSGLSFGVNNEFTTDYGDLPESYGMAWHDIVPSVYLGSTVDGEGAQLHSSNAQGDDDQGDDEDGVQVEPIEPGEMIELTATASSGAYFFQGWIDFNNNGVFDASEHLEFLDPDTGAVLGKQIRLDEDDNQLAFLAPEGIEATTLAARFRYGVGGGAYHGKATGDGLFGEVEDYYLATNASTTFVVPIDGDYDGSGVVDQADYQLWKSSFGQTVTPFTGADGNGDGRVNLADMTIWRNNLGAVAPLQTLSAPLAASTSGDDQAGLDAALPSALVAAAPNPLAAFSSSTDDSDRSAPVGDNNYADSTHAVDLVFDLSEEEEDNYDPEFAESSDTTAEALAVALEQDFGNLL